jgi:hypothetical protein
VFQGKLAILLSHGDALDHLSDKLHWVGVELKASLGQRVNGCTDLGGLTTFLIWN